MLAQVRLAERQGLLNQRRMNRVQVDAVSLLRLAEIIEVERAQIEAVMAQIERDQAAARQAEEDGDEDDEPTTWIMPEHVSSADALDVLRSLGSAGDMTLDDVTEAQQQ